MIDHNDRGRDRTAWSVVALITVFCAALSFSVPAAYAQDAKAESQRYFSIFQSAFNFILENYVDTVDPKALYEGAMQGMFDSLGDPYSVFLTDAMMKTAWKRNFLG